MYQKEFMEEKDRELCLELFNEYKKSRNKETY